MYQSRFLDLLSEEPDSMYRDASDSLRDQAGERRVRKPKVMPRILLVDDDPTFGKIMMRVARQNNIDLTYCKSIDEFGSLENWNYDVALIDFDLGAVTGFELTDYLENFTTEEVPVILVSQSKQSSSDGWPSTIREFVHKSLGPYAVMEAAFEAHEVKRIHKDIGDDNTVH